MNITTHNLTTLNDGDIVRLTKGDYALEGPVIGAGSEFRKVGIDEARLTTRLRDGWTATRVRRAEPPRPTIPGIYRDKDGDPVIVLSATVAFHTQALGGALSATEQMRRLEEHPALAFGYLPFTLVAPFPKESA